MTNMLPGLVSVIIPCYNPRRTIKETVESVRAQTYEQYEIILVDDGSTDGFLDLLVRHRSELRVVRQGNKGRSAARNAGIQAARGEYLLFLDSDDLLLPHCLQYLVTEAKKEFADIVFGKAENFWDRPTLSIATHSQTMRSWIGPEAIIRRNPIHINTALVRSAVVLENRVWFRFGREHYEDWEFWLRLALGGARFLHISSVVALVRLHASNTSGALIRMEMERLRVARDLWGELEGKNVISRSMGTELRRATLEAVFQLGTVLVYCGRQILGRKFLITALGEFFRLRWISRVRLPLLLLFSLVRVGMPKTIIKVVYGRHCALDAERAARIKSGQNVA